MNTPAPYRARPNLSLAAELGSERARAQEGGRMSDIDSARLARGSAVDHVVDADGGYVLCDCTDFSIRGDGCKHCLCVRFHSGDPLLVKALRQLVPAPARSVRAA